MTNADMNTYVAFMEHGGVQTSNEDMEYIYICSTTIGLSPEYPLTTSVCWNDSSLRSTNSPGILVLKPLQLLATAVQHRYRSLTLRLWRMLAMMTVSNPSNSPVLTRSLPALTGPPSDLDLDLIIPGDDAEEKRHWASAGRAFLRSDSVRADFDVTDVVMSDSRRSRDSQCSSLDTSTAEGPEDAADFFLLLPAALLALVLVAFLAFLDLPPEASPEAADEGTRPASVDDEVSSALRFLLFLGILNVSSILSSILAWFFEKMKWHDISGDDHQTCKIPAILLGTLLVASRFFSETNNNTTLRVK